MKVNLSVTVIGNPDEVVVKFKEQCDIKNNIQGKEVIEQRVKEEVGKMAKKHLKRAGLGSRTEKAYDGIKKVIRKYVQSKGVEECREGKVTSQYGKGHSFDFKVEVKDSKFEDGWVTLNTDFLKGAISHEIIGKLGRKELRLF